MTNADTGALERYGFYATRFVVANSAKDAEMKVLSMMRREKIFQPPPGCEKPKDAKVFFEEIQPVRRLLPRLSVGRGATWYLMDDKEETG